MNLLWSVIIIFVLVYFFPTLYHYTVKLWNKPIIKGERTLAYQCFDSWSYKEYIFHEKTNLVYHEASVKHRDLSDLFASFDDYGYTFGMGGGQDMIGRQKLLLLNDITLAHDFKLIRRVEAFIEELNH